jgi:hypothetical protein
MEQDVNIRHLVKLNKIATDILNLLLRCVGRGSSVGIATRYGLDGSGIESRWGATFSAPVQTGPVANAASYAVGTRSFSGVKPHLAPRLKKE